MLVACAPGTKIPDVQVFKEIPFIDAPEAVYVWTTSKREGLMTNAQWEAKRPYVLCVDDKGWADIKTGWLQACRLAGPDCNIMVESVDKLVKELDAVAKKVLKP